MLNIEADELKRLYLDKQLSTYKIAKRFNVCPETVRKKLRKFGIPLRSRHQASKLAAAGRNTRRNRNLECPHCGKKFRSSQGLGSHLKLIHPITEKQEEGFCKGCQNWILWTVTSMGAKIYKCRLKRRPEVKRGKLLCLDRKEF